MDIEKRIEELVKIINEANYNYYTLNNPTITDQEYDAYLRELDYSYNKYINYLYHIFYIFHISLFLIVAIHYQLIIL